MEKKRIYKIIEKKNKKEYTMKRGRMENGANEA